MGGGARARSTAEHMQRANAMLASNQAPAPEDGSNPRVELAAHVLTQSIVASRKGTDLLQELS